MSDPEPQKPPPPASASMYDYNLRFTKASELIACFFEEGVFANAVVPPAVPRGQSLMRTSYMATHTDEELDFILGAFQRVGLRHGVIGKGGTAGPNGHPARNGTHDD